MIASRDWACGSLRKQGWECSQCAVTRPSSLTVYNNTLFCTKRCSWFLIWESTGCQRWNESYFSQAVRGLQIVNWTSLGSFRDAPSVVKNLSKQSDNHLEVCYFHHCLNKDNTVRITWWMKAYWNNHPRIKARLQECYTIFLLFVFLWCRFPLWRWQAGIHLWFIWLFLIRHLLMPGRLDLHPSPEGWYEQV